MIRWSYVEVMVMTFAPPSVRIAPVAMIEPCPFMRRGTEATVPIVPGLVNVMVAPAKSSGTSLTVASRSEEHTSELQSLAYLVCRIIRSEEHTSELQSLAYLV